MALSSTLKATIALLIVVVVVTVVVVVVVVVTVVVVVVTVVVVVVVTVVVVVVSRSYPTVRWPDGTNFCSYTPRWTRDCFMMENVHLEHRSLDTAYDFPVTIAGGLGLACVRPLFLLVLIVSERFIILSFPFCLRSAYALVSLSGNPTDILCQSCLPFLGIKHEYSNASCEIVDLLGHHIGALDLRFTSPSQSFLISPSGSTYQSTSANLLDSAGAIVMLNTDSIFSNHRVSLTTPSVPLKSKGLAFKIQSRGILASSLGWLGPEPLCGRISTLLALPSALQQQSLIKGLLTLPDPLGHRDVDFVQNSELSLKVQTSNCGPGCLCSIAAAAELSSNLNPGLGVTKKVESVELERYGGSRDVGAHS
ncbi:hypothetical protein Tco_0823238 [Tanacetum coccineum]|uniref:Uncharacterized protein n=1 Tax=Tanacetum coccineum TaxID=301880 RepID=A0ABQ5ALX8_9ASTR